MIAPLVASTLFSTAPEVARLVAGLIQKNKANQIDTNRPTMEIPASINDYVNIAQNLSTTGLPNKAAITGDIERGTANALQLSNEYGGNADIASIYANEQQQKRNLGVQDSMQRLSNIAAYQTALKNKAPYEVKVWDYNINQPYQQKIAKAEELSNAGNINAFEAIKNMASIGTGLFNPALKKEPKTTQQPTNGTEQAKFGPADNESFESYAARTGQQIADLNTAQPTQEELMQQFLQMLISNPNGAQSLGKQLGL